ncbi:ubiquitin-specific protease ubp2 [Aspergillus fumigatus]
MSSPSRSGKTAPRLVQDLYDYDPTNPPGTGRNLLSEVPPVFPEGHEGSLDFISPSACHHQYMTKSNQSFLPQAEQKRSTGNPSKVSAVCWKCRYHLQLVVSSTPGIGQSSQGFADHLHHLVYKSGRQKGGASPAEITPKGQTVETFQYECSYLTCPVTVAVRIASPILADEWVRQLVDPDLLRQRADEAIATHPERLEGVGRPSPITVLENLRTYISNALHNSQQSKSISAINKRFMTCFGVEGRPCKDLLEFLGFSVKNEGFWEPPKPNPWAEYPYQDQLKIFLDDVIHELSALIEQRPLAEKKSHQVQNTDTPALSDILYAMDALDYPKALRANEFQMAPAPYYEDLGVVEDMSASSVVEAFNRQVSIDPARSPLYLQCLKSIGNLRGGDDAQIIETAVQLAYAEGRYTQEDIVDAYRYFGLDHNDPRLTDESIIGKFYAFMSSTTQENESRIRLWRIGDSRRSERIKSVAEDRVTNVEQAEIFLGVDSTTSDEFVLTMYTTKVNDNPETRDIARRAVELIAEGRNSAVLRHFLKTGEMTTGEMDVADAYRLLQIPDRTVDDAAIMAAYTICVDEAPGQAERYYQALSIIAKEKNSSLLSSMIAGPGAESGRDLSEWPVGLQNIGNTCYLNSLLQFYFSIRPFREMVLDFESFRMELDDESLSKKRVGSREVLKKEVERSQTFLRELRTLFQNMITSSNSFVTPRPELARLTLISPSNEAAIRRRSTISMTRPGGLGEINGMPIMGPLGPPLPMADQTQSPTDAETETPKRKTTSDVDSEATLVSETAKPDTSLGPSEDKENEVPPADAMLTDIPVSQDIESNLSPKDETPAIAFGPPNQPPPVPPRPTIQVDPQKQLLEEVEIGAQQDVTEVINNVLFQSQCAIKPIAFAQDGEQLDQVKDLFYGRTKSYILAEAGARSKEEWWCDIKVDVATGPRDIYSAIDGAFDAQKVNVDDTVVEQFGAISKLPPVLQIQVQRVQFDPVKKSSFKSTHHLELKETIYLDRYMDTQHPEIMNRRRQCWEWKNTLKTLEDRRAELLRQTENDGLDMATLFDSARAVIEDLDQLKADPETADDGLDFNPQLPSELAQLSQIAKAELNYVEQEIKDTQTMISSQFVDFKHLAYRLYAVFVHHGSVEFGHYYIYIFDFRKNVWRKYNDTEVTEVTNTDEIFKNQERQNPPTPYFLVYVNDGLKGRLADPVCRQIIEDPAPSETIPSTEPIVHMEGVAAATLTSQQDLDTEPPAYDEALADTQNSGTKAVLDVNRNRESLSDTFHDREST